MSIFTDAETLPGVITEINSDYSLGYDVSLFGTTSSVVIIGTAFSGPVGKPIKVYSPDHSTYMFGSAYNSTSKKQATLTAGVKDAWDRGCRSIYAMRVSGSDIVKDFDFCTDSNLKLRIKSQTPSNSLKDCYILIDITNGAEKITIFKPAAQATIAEKQQGIVESDNSIMAVELNLNTDYGYGVDSRLKDVINTFNTHQYNNVLMMSIVDEDGVDQTDSTDAYEICFGAVYPGAYFIGRASSACACETDQKFILTEDTSATKPYSDFAGLYYRKLVMNTDVSKSIPVYYSDVNDIRDILKVVEITVSKSWDFLSVVGSCDKAFLKDTVDYEEVDISKFDLYQKLGSGYVITAAATRRVDGSGNEITPRVKETEISDTNRILEIDDGIYSILENAQIDYRVLTFGCADDALANKLPKAADFLTMLPKTVNVLANDIVVTPKIASTNRLSAKAYSFKFEEVTDYGMDTFTDIYTDEIVKVISKVDTLAEIATKAIEAGTYIMQVAADKTGTLYRVTSSGIEKLNGSGLVDTLYLVEKVLYVGTVVGGSTVFVPAVVTVDAAGGVTYKSKEYLLGENNNSIYVFQVIDDPVVTVKPLGDFESMAVANDEKTLVYFESNPFGTNDVIIKSAAFAGLTLSELVDFLNNQISLKEYFTFELTEDASANKDDIVNDVASAGYDVASVLAADRELSYDYTKYIPYRTTDNLARQLAQHATYTKIKTGPTHALIGINPITDTGLSGVTKRIAVLTALELDLYAKNATGRNLLDENNMPYPIGGNISIPAAQYTVTMDDAYVYTSNSAAGYAGMVSTLPLDQSSTNQPISLVSDPGYILNNYQLTKLTKKGFVTIKSSLTLGYVITDGITMALSTSHFKRLSVSRIMGGVETLLRAAAEPFIGKVNSTANKNGLSTAIKSALDNIKDVLINDYSFTMDLTAATAKLNDVGISYIIVPLYEIRQVKNTITLNDQT